jgi:hypothetical protein
MRLAGRRLIRMRKSTIILLVAAAGFTAFVFYSLWRVEPVRVVRSSLEHADGKVFVAGELRNTGPKSGPFDLEVHYFDSAGRPIGQDKILVGAMPQGAQTAFRTPERSLPDASEFSIYLNHGRNPYGN